jgi:hypothetical protein
MPVPYWTTHLTTSRFKELTSTCRWYATIGPPVEIVCVQLSPRAWNTRRCPRESTWLPGTVPSILERSNFSRQPSLIQSHSRHPSIHPMHRHQLDGAKYHKEFMQMGRRKLLPARGFTNSSSSSSVVTGAWE